MFSNLASYLGYATSSAKPQQGESEQAEMRLHAVEEDDWVLVERNEKKGLQEEADEDAQMTRVTLSASTCPGALFGSSRGMSRSSSLDVLSPFQESWYLTPPPSFTSEGPVHMETSPLENLLIEHPSMSVYERSQRTDTPRKMSNSSPSTVVASEEEYPVVMSAIKEKIYKLPRNKLNAKLSKTQSTITNSNPVPIPPVPLEKEEAEEVKEPKMKSFVKSPRRTINAELQNLPKKSLRKRPETAKTNEMISKTSPSEDVVSKETNPILPNVQNRRLYSEVLASKPKVPAVQAPPTTSPEAEEPAPKPKPSQVSSHTEVLDEAASKSCESESVMTVEESVDEVTEERQEDRDRRKAVQTLPDRQHRLHFLNRSAQKVEQRKTCDLMKKNPLIRTNKAREFNFRNKRQRRADMMQRHSGANNNRKCAKTSLY